MGYRGVPPKYRPRLWQGVLVIVVSLLVCLWLSYGAVQWLFYFSGR